MPGLYSDQPPKSICLLRLSAIGDITHMLPVVATLKTCWPDTKITWIIGSVEHSLVKSISGIDFIVFSKKNGLSELSSLKQKLAGRHFDLLLMMQVSLRANLISLIINAHHKIGYDKARSRDFHNLFINHSIDGPSRVHVLDTFFQFLDKIGISDRKMDWLLKSSESDLEFSQSLVPDNPTVIINACSSARKNNWRNWPIESYAAVINFLSQHNYQVVLTGGPSSQEVDYSNQISATCKTKPINLVGKTSLPQLFAIMQRALCLIAPDTGPAHMGTAAGIPVIGLYASSNPERTGPYNSQHILVNCYPAALEKYNHNTADNVSWGARVRHPDVMNLITVDDVIDRLTHCLGITLGD